MAMGSASTKSDISTSRLSISRGGKFTREKSSKIGVYCLDRQAWGPRLFLTDVSALSPYLGQAYGQSGFGGRVRLSSLSGQHGTLGEQFSVRVGKMEIGQDLSNLQQSLRVEFLFKTDGGYPKNTGITTYTLATHGNPLRYNTHRSAPPVSALAHSKVCFNSS